MGFETLVQIERDAQDRKWGEQNHDVSFWHLILAEEVGELAKAILEHKVNPLAFDDTSQELIHVVAVAKAMWESGKRNGWL